MSLRKFPPLFCSQKNLMHSSFKQAHFEEAYKEVSMTDKEIQLAKKGS